MTAHAKFEPENPPFFEGHAEVEVLDPAGVAPQTIIDVDDSWQVKVTWRIIGSNANGMLPFMANSDWKVSAYIESLGPGTDVPVGTTQTVPFSGGTPGLASEREYETTISVASGLDPGTYRLVTVILAEDSGPPITHLEYAAFVDGPVIQLYEVGP